MSLAGYVEVTWDHQIRNDYIDVNVQNTIMLVQNILMLVFRKDMST